MPGRRWSNQSWGKPHLQLGFLAAVEELAGVWRGHGSLCFASPGRCVLGAPLSSLMARLASGYRAQNQAVKACLPLCA